jgi:AraC-like DNA-binding protein
VGIAIWLRRLRFVDALHALRAGRSVTDAAFDAGYAAPSAFIAAFKREFLTTPRAFVR